MRTPKQPWRNVHCAICDFARPVNTKARWFKCQRCGAVNQITINHISGTGVYFYDVVAEAPKLMKPPASAVA